MRRAALLLAGLLAAGCTKDRTEIVIGVVTDLYATALIDKVQLQVLREGVPVLLHDWDLSGVPGTPYELPGSFGIFSSDGSEPRLQVIAIASLAGKEIVRRESLVTLAAEKTLFMRMAIVQRCQAGMGPACPSGQTCVEGTCKTTAVDRRRLPAYVADMEKKIGCDSGSTFLNTSTRQAMETTGLTCKQAGASCVEGTCYPPPPVAGTSQEALVACSMAAGEIGRWLSEHTTCAFDEDCAVVQVPCGFDENGSCAVPAAPADATLDAAVQTWNDRNCQEVVGADPCSCAGPTNRKVRCIPIDGQPGRCGWVNAV